MRRIASGTNGGIGIGQLLQAVEAMTAMAAFEFVDGHGNSGHADQRGADNTPLSGYADGFQRTRRCMVMIAPSSSLQTGGKRGLGCQPHAQPINAIYVFGFMDVYTSI